MGFVRLFNQPLDNSYIGEEPTTNLYPGQLFFNNTSKALMINKTGEVSGFQIVGGDGFTFDTTLAAGGFDAEATGEDKTDLIIGNAAFAHMTVDEFEAQTLEEVLRKLCGIARTPAESVTITNPTVPLSSAFSSAPGTYPAAGDVEIGTKLQFDQSFFVTYERTIGTFSAVFASPDSIDQSRLLSATADVPITVEDGVTIDATNFLQADTPGTGYAVGTTVTVGVAFELPGFVRPVADIERNNDDSGTIYGIKFTELGQNFFGPVTLTFVPPQASGGEKAPIFANFLTTGQRTRFPGVTAHLPGDLTVSSLSSAFESQLDPITSFLLINLKEDASHILSFDGHTFAGFTATLNFANTELDSTVTDRFVNTYGETLTLPAVVFPTEVVLPDRTYDAFVRPYYRLRSHADGSFNGKDAATTYDLAVVDLDAITSTLNVLINNSNLTRQPNGFTDEFELIDTQIATAVNTLDFNFRTQKMIFNGATPTASNQVAGNAPNANHYEFYLPHIITSTDTIRVSKVEWLVPGASGAVYVTPSDQAWPLHTDSAGNLDSTAPEDTVTFKFGDNFSTTDENGVTTSTFEGEEVTFDIIRLDIRNTTGALIMGMQPVISGYDAHVRFTYGTRPTRANTGGTASEVDEQAAVAP